MQVSVCFLLSACIDFCWLSKKEQTKKTQKYWMCSDVLHGIHTMCVTALSPSVHIRLHSPSTGDQLIGFHLSTCRISCRIIDCLRKQFVEKVEPFNAFVTMMAASTAPINPGFLFSSRWTRCTLCARPVTGKWPWPGKRMPVIASGSCTVYGHHRPATAAEHGEVQCSVYFRGHVSFFPPACIGLRVRL